MDELHGKVAVVTGGASGIGAALGRAFAAQGLNAERHLVFLPRLSTQDFLGAASVCDAFLDGSDWSGCNSALECLSVDLPIVTSPGPLMRGRHCLADGCT